MPSPTSSGEKYGTREPSSQNRLSNQSHDWPSVHTEPIQAGPHFHRCLRARKIPELQQGDLPSITFGAHHLIHHTRLLCTCTARGIDGCRRSRHMSIIRLWPSRFLQIDGGTRSRGAPDCESLESIPTYCLSFRRSVTAGSERIAST